MIIAPFLSPLYQGYVAYRATHFSGLEVTHPELRRSLIESNSGHEIKKHVQTFLEKQGIREDLIIREEISLVDCMAVGTNDFRKGDAVIYFPKNFYATDKQACLGTLKHEVCHIKNNDGLKIPLVCAVCSAAAAVFSFFIISTITATIITIAVSTIAYVSFSNYCENRADNFAIAASNNEELKGFRRYLKACQQTNLELAKKLRFKFSVSPTGENRFDILHPSLSSRLKKIERSLQERNVDINKEEDETKIEELKNLFLGIVQKQGSFF